MSLGKRLITTDAAGGVVATDNFSVITYSGTGGVQSTNSLSSQAGTVDFEPSFVWIKARTSATLNSLFDSIRGTANFLSSSTTTKALTTSDDGTLANTLTAFNSNGFSLGSDSGLYGVNISSVNYVAYSWYAPTSETNNAGVNGATSQSIIKKNIDAGFSIVKYTGNETDQHKVYHGLGAVPKMIILKCTGATNPWYVYHEGVDASNPADYNLRLNESDARQDSSTEFSDTPPTSNVFTLGTTTGTNKNSTDYKAYCFADIAGYQKLGVYDGDNSTSNVVEVGFTPRFLMTKRANISGDWHIWDNMRSTSDPRNKVLRPNSSAIESSNTTQNVNFNATSFELASSDSSINATGSTYIYLAIA